MNELNRRKIWTFLCLLLAVTFFFMGNKLIAGVWLIAFAVQLVITIIGMKNGK
jgi:hypothetical protein